MNNPEFFDIMSLVDDDHINILYARREKVAQEKLSAKGRKKFVTLWLKRIALVLITTVTVLAGILLTNGDVRAAIAKTFITWYDEYIQFDFSKSTATEEPQTGTEQESIENIYDITVGYIPNGFKSVYEIEDDYTREYSYDSVDGSYLLIGIYDSKYTDIGVSDNNFEHEKLIINNRETYISYDEQERTGSVSFGDDIYCVLIYGLSIDKEVLIEVAENIRKNDNTEDKEQAPEIKDIYDLEIGYIPDGFELSESHEIDGARDYFYFNGPDEYLVIGFFDSDKAEYSLSYDDSAEYDQIKLNGTDAYIFYNKQEKTGTILYGNDVYYVNITGIVEKDELIKVAESIK